MELSQATSYFNRASLEGWDGSAWLPLNIRADLQSYDRFIGPRTFGHKQRVLVTGPDNFIPDSFEFVRLEKGKPYLIISYNDDIDDTGAYGRYYIVQEMPYVVQLVEIQATVAPSGLHGDSNKVVIASTFGDFERFTAENARDIDAVSFINYSFTLPLSLPVNTDHLLEISGTEYEVKEVNPFLNVKQIRAVKRGTRDFSYSGLGSVIEETGGDILLENGGEISQEGIKK